MTESYISQLLSGKKLPPASDRTELYKKTARFLGVPERQLTNLADAERQEKLKLKVLHPPRPLFLQFRSMILRKCANTRRSQVAAIFNREPFGEFERLITQTLLDVTKTAIRDELTDPSWVTRFAKLTRQTHEDAQVLILDFLDTDVFHITLDNWVSLLGPSPSGTLTSRASNSRSGSMAVLSVRAQGISNIAKRGFSIKMT